MILNTSKPKNDTAREPATLTLTMQGGGNVIFEKIDGTLAFSSGTSQLHTFVGGIVAIDALYDIPMYKNAVGVEVLRNVRLWYIKIIAPNASVEIYDDD